MKRTLVLQPEDQIRVMRLLATMVIYESYPDYLNETRAVEHKFEVGRNFFQNLMMVRKTQNEALLVGYEKNFFVSSKRWPPMPLSVSVLSANIDYRAENARRMKSTVKIVKMKIFATYRIPSRITMPI